MKRFSLLLLLAFGLTFVGCKKQAANNNPPKTDTKKQPMKNRPAAFKRTASPAGAKVFIEEPKDGATVEKTFTVKFGVSGMEIVPAGNNKPNSGHHHLLIDTTTMPDMGQPLPMTKQLMHFGKGQTSTSLTLPPGKHTLQLLLGDYLHIPHNPPVLSEKITITVK